MNQDVHDKAILIFSKTNDGDDLSSSDLKLVEMATNGLLNAKGIARFDELHARVRDGKQASDWFHGIEHLTKHDGGQVRWRGKAVEEFRFKDAADERLAAVSLARRCLLLESVGVQPTQGAVMRSEYLLPYGADERTKPWVQALAQRDIYTLKERTTDGVKQAAILFFVQGPRHPVLAGLAADSKNKVAVALDPVLEDDRSEAGIALYRRLDSEGYTSMYMPTDANVWHEWTQQLGLEPQHLVGAIGVADDFVASHVAAEQSRRFARPTN